MKEEQRWSFKINASRGEYEFIGLRNSGHIVQCSGPKGCIDIHKMAIAVEATLAPSDSYGALYWVLCAIVPKVDEMREPGGFGSWYIKWVNKTVVYDGRDSWLLAQLDKKDVKIMRAESQVKEADLRWLLQWVDDA